MSLWSSKDKKLRNLLLELENGKPRIRAKAAQGLSSLERAEAIPYLIKALSDTDRKVRWRVAYSLSDFGEIGHDQAYEALVSHLRSERDWNVRRIIIMGLRHWDKRAEKPLIAALKDESSYVRRYAAMTLGFKKIKTAIPYLIKLNLEDDSKEVRDYAGWALGVIK